MAEVGTNEFGISKVSTADIGVAEVGTCQVLSFEGATSEILTGEVLGHYWRWKVTANFDIDLAQKLWEWDLLTMLL
jgi:hypothetical protein